MLGERDVNMDTLEFQGNFLTENCYQQAWWGTNSNNNSGSAQAQSVRNAGQQQLQKQFIDGAQAFLEQQYLRFVRHQVSTNPEVSQLGGIPAPRHLIRAFLNSKVVNRGGRASWPAQLEIGPEGYPIWAEIYYCMRCGFWDTALQIAKSSPWLGGNEGSSVSTYAASTPVESSSFAAALESYLKSNRQ
jgi:hypothetical protein